MLAYMLATLLVFAVAGTVLLHPSFRTDLVHFRRHKTKVRPDREELEKIVSRMSVIIPARNEENTLPLLLDSLEAQTMKPAEVIVVDDQSEDATAEIARRAFTRVVSAGEHPDGWLGKPWALHRGTQEARGDLFLFLDADVRLEPGALETLAGTSRALSPEWPRAVTTLSVQPFHRTVRYRERLALLFNILVFVGAAERRRGLHFSMGGSCCFGPCILCGRSEYESSGGHQAIRRSILDDIDLGRRFVSSGTRVQSFSGRGVVEFRMYPEGSRALVDGFTKNVLLGAQRSGMWFKILAVLWVTGLLAAPLYIGITIAAGMVPEAIVASVFFVFFAVQFAVAGRRVGNFGYLPALFYPVHLLLFLAVLLRASLLAVTGRNVRWKGRSLHADSGRA
jgi:4,4'-diaponeurosporenoate glycosyltransferase